MEYLVGPDSLVGHYVLIHDLSPSEWPRLVLPDTKYLGNVVKRLDNKYHIRVIGQVNDTYEAADYEENVIIVRNIEQVDKVPVGRFILSD